MTPAFPLTLALTLAVAHAPATELPPEVVPILDRATKAWEAERYEQAAEAYAEVYVQTGDIAYLYARAQALQRSGDCETAIETYEAFIATEPLGKAVQAAQARIDECRALLPEPPPEPAPDPDPVLDPIAPPVVPDPAPPIDDASRPWARDPTAISLATLGGVGIVTGVALAVVAQSEQAAADRADDVVEYGTRNDRAVVLSRVSIPVLAVGGALVVGSAIRWAVLARRNKRALSRIGPGLSLRW